MKLTMFLCYLPLKVTTTTQIKNTKFMKTVFESYPRWGVLGLSICSGLTRTV